MKLFEIKQPLPIAHSDFLTDPAAISDWLLKRARATTEMYKILPDGSVDTKKGYHIELKLKAGETRLPVRFNRAGDRFIVRGASLRTLEGFPRIAAENVEILNTGISSLEGFPSKVGGNIWLVGNNRLTSLQGLPSSCGYFACIRSGITTLEGMPKKVTGISVSDNPKLISLRGAPKAFTTQTNTDDRFDNHDAGNFDCDDCKKLTSLEGMTQVGVKNINCSNTAITSLKGIARKFEELRCTAFITSDVSLKGIEKMIDYAVDIDLEVVTEGGLGLILIPGLTSVAFFTLRPDGEYHVKDSSNMNDASDIIQKYLGKPDEIFECQEELINAGFEQIAQL